MSDRKRAMKVVRTLEGEYPQVRIALDFKDPLQLLVATILSAQCTDKRVNQITPGLFKRYPDAEAFADADQKELEQDIRPTGFYRNKAKNIISASRMIVGEFGGRVPDTMEGLLRLPGVARKTANIVLTNAYGKVEGIAVDTHVARLSQRLGFSGHKDPNRIERDLMALMPKEEWRKINRLFIAHGRAVCSARKPRCRECAVREMCPSAR